MTLQEILDKADKKVPNSETAADKVKIADTLQKRIYRKYKIPTKFDYEMVEGVYAYNVGIPESKVFDVLVDGMSIPKKKVGGTSTATSDYYYFLDDFLNIYPTPTADGVLSVFAYETPESLSASKLGDTPSLDEDFHDMLVYGIAIELAENAQKSENVIEFRRYYDKLEDELAEVFPFTPEVTTIQSESGW